MIEDRGFQRSDILQFRRRRKFLRKGSQLRIIPHNPMKFWTAKYRGITQISVQISYIFGILYIWWMNEWIFPFLQKKENTAKICKFSRHFIGRKCINLEFCDQGICYWQHYDLKILVNKEKSVEKTKLFFVFTKIITKLFAEIIFFY